MRTLIRNGTAIINGRAEKTNILIEEDLVISTKADPEAKADKIIDADGLYVLPGLVDAHCHLRDPGYEYKEDIISGTRSAARGGFTSIACMPNTNPPVDNAAVVRYIIEKSRKEGCVNVFPIGAITKGLEGNELSEMGFMREAGIVAVSDDGKPVMNSDVMKKALIYAGQFGLPVISHCEDLNLTDNGCMNEGLTSTILGLRGIPSVSEDVMVAREILLSQYTGVPVHIAHVSTKISVELIRQAKKRGIKVTAETCPHYFTLTEEACRDYNTNAKMNPPLRSRDDLEAVIEGLKDGTIDIIATDHAPHHFDEKNVEFEKAANGIVGFETALALSYTELVDKGHLSLSQMIDKLTVNPANMLKIDKGKIERGKPADIILVDFDNEYRVDVSKFASKSKNSPFDGFKVKGRVKTTIVGGNIVYEDI
ncbi:MAG: dihydroorotase [Clostridiaceae bacterium]|nr:dihydroorotase [Clostridiaceae bacterium]